MALLLGIDMGATGPKTALLDGDGQVKDEAASEYSTSHPFAGWAEQNPEMWWEGLRSTVHELTISATARP